MDAWYPSHLMTFVWCINSPVNFHHEVRIDAESYQEALGYAMKRQDLRHLAYACLLARFDRSEIDGTRWYYAYP